MKKYYLFFLLLPVFSCGAFPQAGKIITDEADVPPYTLPELLLSNTGSTIITLEDWEKIRRPEIIALLEKEQYGKVPGRLNLSEIRVLDNNDQALNGTAIRKQVLLVFRKNGKELTAELLMYLPKSKKSFPTFLGYNFNGNHTIQKDAGIHIARELNGPAKDRGSSSDNWPVEMIINSGCGVATLYYWEIAPDKNDLSTGIYPLFYREGQIKPQDDEWGSISAWAWGLSRALDYLETDRDLDAKKVIVFGHSRLGKTAIWAGATDQRFAGVISNNSGCCGAALSKRIFGETVGVVNDRFPQWFCGNFKKYSNREDFLPFDQHMALALIAPRPLYVASASEDSWADPKGEYLATCHAAPVYQLYGYVNQLDLERLPQADAPVTGLISYHIRKGKHDILAYDWQWYISFGQKFAEKK